MSAQRFVTGGAVLGAAVTGVLLLGGVARSPTPAAVPVPLPAAGDPPAAAPAREMVVFSGGCFWGVQAVFEHVKGVVSATSGYAGGASTTAHYELTTSGATGHAESVQVVFDPSQVSFGQLLAVFFSVAHDPTQRNRQGPDVGPQYRSAIWTTTEAQGQAARAYIVQLEAAKTFAKPIVTDVQPLPAFYPAETYHQDYLIHHPHQPYIVINDLPKLDALRRQFPALWREDPVTWRPEMVTSEGR